MFGFHQLLRLFRVFWPSWRFFDQVGAQPQLLGRFDSGPWQTVLLSPQRQLSHLFLNPQGNLRHAQDSIVERLLQEATEVSGSEALENSLSYRLVENLVRVQARKVYAIQPNTSFQFKICATYPKAEDLLISATHRV